MIFPWLWKLLPESNLGKVAVLSGSLALSFIILFSMVFPALDSFLVDPPTVE